MTTTKYLLGTLTVLGGIYLYDQNVQPIFPRKQQINKDLNRIDQKQTELSNKLSNRINQSKQQINKQPPLNEQIKESRLYQDLSNQAHEYKAAVKEASTPQKDKNILIRGIDKYIDFVNSIGDANKTTTDLSTVSRRTEIKEKSWFDWFKNDEDKLKKRLEDTKSDIEAKKNQWLNWGSKKSDEFSREAARQYDSSKQELHKQKSKFESNFDETRKQLTERYNEEKKRAIENYERAKANLDDISSKFFKSTEPDKHEKLQRAKEDFNSSLTNLKSYGDDVFNETNAKVKDSLGK